VEERGDLKIGREEPIFATSLTAEDEFQKNNGIRTGKEKEALQGGSTVCTLTSRETSGAGREGMGKKRQ